MLRTFFAVLMAFLAFGTGSGQVATGVYQFGAFDNLGLDTINVGNANVHFSLPVLNKAGRGLPFYYNLSYDSSVWSPVSINGSQVWALTPNAGWRGDTEVALGYVSYQTGVTTGTVPDSPSNHPQKCYNYRYLNFTYHDGLGAAHPFSTTTYNNDQCEGNRSVDSATATASDGSGFTISISNYNQVQVTGRDGRVYNPPTNNTTGAGVVTDSNGNQISAGSSGTFIDTTGATALTVASSNNSQTFTYTDTNGHPQSVSMNYSSYTVQTAFGCSGVAEFGPQATQLVSSINFPDGSSYSFTYEPTSGAGGNVTGRLQSITVPQGGTISYQYTGGSNGINCADGSAAGLTRSTAATALSPASTWTFARTITSNSSHTLVTDGMGNNLDYDFVTPTGSNFSFKVNQNAWTGPNAGGHQYSQQTCYNNSGSICIGTAITLPVTQMDVYGSINDAQEAGSTTTYNNFGEPTQVTTHDFGPMGSVNNDHRGPVLATETLVYGGNGAPTNLLTSDVTLDQNGNTVAYKSYAYDQGYLAVSKNVPSHVGVSGPRGNLTTYSVIDGSITTMTYEDTGSLLSSTDSINGPTSYGYDPTFTYVTSTILPTPSSDVSMTTGAGYDTTYTGMPTSSTDVNSQQTKISSYDSMLRPVEVDNPDGGKTVYSSGPAGEIVYSYQNPNVYGLYVTSNDNYGRLSRTALSNGNNSWYQQDMCYDANGNLQFKSYAYTGTGFNAPKICSGAGDTYSYDVLGRLNSITHGDGTNTKQQISYNARATQTTDENGVSKISQVDGLGRLTAVCELSSAVMGSLSPANCGTDIGGTGYVTSYNYGTTLTTFVSQSGQTRSFQTDELGRPTTIVEPERGTTTYSYSSNTTGLVVIRKRPRANQTNPAVQTTTTTQYDTLSRPLSVTYDDNLTPNKTYMYDQTNAWGGSSFASLGFSKGRLTRELVSAGNGTGQVFGYDSMGRVVHMEECRPSTCGYSSDVMNYTYDWTGNMLSSTDGVGTYSQYNYTVANEPNNLAIAWPGGGLVTILSGVQQSQFGPTSFTLVNGVTEAHQHDVMGRFSGSMLCSGSSSASCNGGTLLNYSTINWSGMRANSSTLNGNSSSVYGYDDFNRLTSVTTNGTQTYGYTYDVWGNRLTQQGGATVTTDGSNHLSTMVYDAAGNVISDGVTNYTYDAEGNVISNGSQNYTYDALNHRVRIDSGSSYQEFDFNAAGQRVSIWSGPTTPVQGQYIWGGKPVGYYTTTSGWTQHYQHQNWVGTESVRTTSSGTVEGSFTQGPFGEYLSVNGSDTDRAHYAGQDQDSPSNSHAQFRELQTAYGRWLSPDPSDASYSSLLPQSLNRYVYSLNNPLSLSDPTGLQCVWDDGSFDADDDPATGFSTGCEAAGGTYIDPGAFGTLNAGDWSNQADSGLAAIANSLSGANNFTYVSVSADGSGYLDQTGVTLSGGIQYIIKNDSTWTRDSSQALAAGVMKQGIPKLCAVGVSVKLGKLGASASASGSGTGFDINGHSIGTETNQNQGSAKLTIPIGGVNGVIPFNVHYTGSDPLSGITSVDAGGTVKMRFGKVGVSFYINVGTYTPNITDPGNCP